MKLADEANRYIDEKKPWVLFKDDQRLDEVHQVCTQGINLFRTLMVYLKPIIPFTTEKAEAFLKAGELTWADASRPLLDHEIEKFQPLITRLDEKTIDAMVEDSKEDLKAKDDSGNAQSDFGPEITIDDFAKLDLRVARIVTAEHVEGADKLLRLKLDLGGPERTVFAGIKAAYDPSELEGKLVVAVANLKPREMKFGTSEGMVLAAGPGGKDIFVISPDSGAEPGMKVK
jgi:methionyl-tRNA synthetase